jgi:hypothetical protein
VAALFGEEFNSEMADFFRSRDGDGMFRFLTSCRLAADAGVIPRGDGE